MGSTVRVFLLVKIHDIHHPLLSSTAENTSDSTNQKFHLSHLPTQSQAESCRPQQEPKILPRQPKLTPLQTAQHVSSSLSPSLPSLVPHTNSPSPTPHTNLHLPTPHTNLHLPTPHTNSPSPTPHTNLHLPTLHTFATQYISSGREHHRRVRRKSVWEEEAERWERRVQRKASGIKQD